MGSSCCTRAIDAASACSASGVTQPITIAATDHARQLHATVPPNSWRSMCAVFSRSRCRPKSNEPCGIDPFLPAVASPNPPRCGSVAGVRGHARERPSELMAVPEVRWWGIGHRWSRTPDCPQRRRHATIRCAAGHGSIRNRLGAGVSKSPSVADASSHLCRPEGGLTIHLS